VKITQSEIFLVILHSFKLVRVKVTLVRVVIAFVIVIITLIHVEITLVRVEITVVSVVITFVHVKVTMRVEITLWVYFRECHILTHPCQNYFRVSNSHPWPVKSHSACGSRPLRVEINLLRVKITLVRVRITFVLKEFTLRVKITF
jgi:hypothetical protein